MLYYLYRGLFIVGGNLLPLQKRGYVVRGVTLWGWVSRGEPSLLWCGVSGCLSRLLGFGVLLVTHRLNRGVL